MDLTDLENSDNWSKRILPLSSVFLQKENMYQHRFLKVKSVEAVLYEKE
tara:strand:- start:830 stop:976 length:147 start_codon:yes stop_codon:yes gene_type:complete